MLTWEAPKEMIFEMPVRADRASSSGARCPPSEQKRKEKRVGRRDGKGCVLRADHNPSVVSVAGTDQLESSGFA